MLSSLNLTGIIITDISDHLANCLILPPLTTAKSAPDRPLVRIFSQKNKLHFSNELSSCDWNGRVYNCLDVNSAYENFSSSISSSYELCFPLIKLSRKRSKDKKWITTGIIKSCNVKSKLYKTWIAHRNQGNKDKYTNYIKVYNKVL